MNQRKSVPAPIFNARKRPRQAVITEPGNQFLNEPSFPDSSSSDLMPVHGFRQPNSHSPRNNHTERSFRGNQQGKFGRQDNRNNRGRGHVNSYNNNNNQQQQNSRGGFSRNRGSFTQQGKQHRPTSNWSSGQGQSGRLTSGQYQPDHENQEHRSPLNRSYPSFTSGENRDTKRPQTSGQLQHRHGQNTGQPGHGQSTGHSGHGQNAGQFGRGQNAGQVWRGQSAGHLGCGNRNDPPWGGASSGSLVGGQSSTNSWSGPAGDNRFPVNNAATPQAQKPNVSIDQNSRSISSHTFSNNTAQTSTQKVVNTVGTSKQTPTKTTDDSTLHIITTNTEGVVRWNKYKDYMNLMFELYGIVDSAVITDQSGTAKQFVLRDDCGDLQCTFYEIDRPLPQLTRGYLHRVVGTFDSRNNYLKCLSVRPCSPDEANMAYQNAYRQQDHLIELTKQFREQ